MMPRLLPTALCILLILVSTAASQAQQPQIATVHREIKNPHPQPPLQVWRGGFRSPFPTLGEGGRGWGPRKGRSLSHLWKNPGERLPQIYKIGISVWTGYPTSVKGFKEAMTAEGLLEGKNVKYLYGKCGLNPERQREIVTGFRDAGVDLVYSLTTPGTTIVKEIMPTTTPIVFSIVTYPADSGLIESLDYSGNNLVGTSNYVELSAYIRLLKTILPHTRTLAIFRRNKEPNSKIQAANIIRLAKKQGLKTIDMPLESVEQVREAALGLVGKADVFMTTTDTLMQGGGEEALIKVSLEKKIPILSSNKVGIEQGSTFGPVADFYVLGKMSGRMAAKILKEHVAPARLHSEIQDPPLILINKRSAEALGIRIPEDKLENFQYVE